MKTPLFCSFALLITVVACGDDEAEHGHPHPQPAAASQPADHGAAQKLGTVTVGSTQFDVVRLGDLQPGVEGAFEVTPLGTAAANLTSLNAYLWLESEDGTQVSAPTKGIPEAAKLHFHATPQKGDRTPFRVVLRLRADGADDRGSLPLDGHGHEHAHGPHSGVPGTFRGAGTSGHLELKLHDDKGDLELWLGKDAQMTEPFDLPLDATIEVEFIDVQGRKVVLRARNAVNNEDEDGKSNVRDGKTNYFIFPGETGADASWLRGKEFHSIVVVRGRIGDTEFTSEELMLEPHVH
ncbi:MAG: hypothetical protein HZB39_15490 [Planctomycetes bacterium]|nr:hypothetical protein [Planctomycetota bacterium]